MNKFCYCGDPVTHRDNTYDIDGQENLVHWFCDFHDFVTMEARHVAV